MSDSADDDRRQSLADDDHQRTLPDTPPEADPSRTVQERVLSLYRSENVFHTAAGFWAKLLIEGAIVAVPLFVVVVLPGLVIHTLGIHPEITATRVVIAWATFVTTVVGFTWCFTDATVER